MTQHELVMDYVRTMGEIYPAKCSGHEWNGGFFGAETSKRCRELRKWGKLESKRDGKFEKFYLPQPVQQSLFKINQYQMQ